MALIKPSVPVINWSNPLTKGLILDYPMVEKGGSNSIDLIGRYIGTFSNISWITDLYGSGLSFNGVSSSVSFNKIVDTAVFSYFAIIYSVGGSGQRTIKSNKTDPNGIQWRVDTNNKLDIVKMSSVDLGPSTGSVPQNVWCTVAVTYNTSGKISYYINGALDSTVTNSQTFSLDNIWVGRHQSATAEWFNGKMAVLRMWNRVLSPLEVKQLYNNPWQIYKSKSFLKNPMFKGKS